MPDGLKSQLAKLFLKKRRIGKGNEKGCHDNQISVRREAGHGDANLPRLKLLIQCSF
jgi:hypothetical protein